MQEQLRSLLIQSGVSQLNLVTPKLQLRLKRNFAAVPYSILWDAIGTSRTEKPANSSSKVTLTLAFRALLLDHPGL